jgi:hypothetical protein
MQNKVFPSQIFRSSFALIFFISLSQVENVEDVDLLVKRVSIFGILTLMATKTRWPRGSVQFDWVVRTIYIHAYQLSIYNFSINNKELHGLLGISV